MIKCCFLHVSFLFLEPAALTERSWTKGVLFTSIELICSNFSCFGFWLKIMNVSECGSESENVHRKFNKHRLLAKKLQLH